MVVEDDPSERPDPPRRRTLSFWVVLIFVVAPLWSVAPLSWAYIIWTRWSGRTWSLTWPGRILTCLALCEVFFSVYHYNLVRDIAKVKRNTPVTLSELQAAYRRVLKAGLAQLSEDDYDEESLFLARPGSPYEDINLLDKDDPRAVDFREALRNWFGRVPFSEIRRQEVYEWLHWSTFNEFLPPLNNLTQNHRAVLDDALLLLEKRSGVQIPEGSNAAAKPIRLTLDKVNVYMRPFIFYALVGAINWFLRLWYEHKWNTHHGKYRNLEYLLRMPETWDPQTGPRPIVFMHGLGLGLFQYHFFLSSLLHGFPDCPILVPLQPHVSQNIFHQRYLLPMGRHETADCVAGLMAELGWVQAQGGEMLTPDEREKADVKQFAVDDAQRGVTMLSHSNGTYAHAWVLKSYPYMINRSCFIDPVTFCSWEGDTCYNFIYKPCSTGLELVMRYFVGAELGVANVLQRHFDWSSNALWFEDIPNARDPAKAMFVMGGKDAVLKGERVRKYLRSHGVQKGILFNPDGHHGQALIEGATGHSEIFRWIADESP